MKSAPRSMWSLLLLVVAVGAAQQWLAHRHDHSIGAEVARLARPGDIRMISSESCVYCLQARNWFQANRIPFTECLVERDAACRAEFQALRAPGTPMMLVRGRAQVGFSPNKLRQALQVSATDARIGTTP